MEADGFDESEGFPHERMIQHAKEIAAEIQIFADYYATEVATRFSVDGKHVTTSLVMGLKSQLQSEIKGMEGAAKRFESQDSMALQTLASSNIPFFATLWGVAKQSRDVVAFRKWLCSTRYKGKEVLAPGTHILPMSGASVPGTEAKALVDIIANGGQKWIKVSSTTSKRLLWDLTKLGWAIGVDESDDDGDDEMYEDVPLYKLAKSISDAAGVHRIRSRHPAVQLILPRIEEGTSKDTDGVLNAIRRLGIEIICTSKLEAAPPLTQEIMETMAPNPFTHLSEKLNVDTSLLIALVSDLSHTTVEKQDWFSGEQLVHLEQETTMKILPTWVYPALGEHELLCTKEAASKCREIATILGTETEIARTRLLFGDGTPSRDQQALLSEWDKLSSNATPRGLRLPVRIVDGDIAAWKRALPDQARRVLDEITDPTRSVFAYGWATRQTTVTSNGFAINVITRSLEDLQDGYAGEWPSMWQCPVSRSLVGVPKHLR